MTFSFEQLDCLQNYPATRRSTVKTLPRLLRTYYICFGVSENVRHASFQESSSIVGVILLSGAEAFWENSIWRETHGVIADPTGACPRASRAGSFYCS